MVTSMSPALALVRAQADPAHRPSRGRGDAAGAPTPGAATPAAAASFGPLGAAEEQRLVANAQRGDAEAFGALVRAHQRRAYAVARAIVATHEDAEDAVQDGFLNAFRALDRFLPGQPFGAWLHRIVANAALDSTRRRRVRDADTLSENLAASWHDPGESADLRARLHVGLATLTERQRAVIVLHDVQGFRHGEIGRLLNIPEGTARSDLFHARLALRRSLRALHEVR
jgi:RNA polymerase sigma-70 factor (ECF subfamily)